MDYIYHYLLRCDQQILTILWDFMHDLNINNFLGMLKHIWTLTMLRMQQSNAPAMSTR